MTHFGDIIKLLLLKYAIKMTSQIFFIFKPSPLLAKSWLRYWKQANLTVFYPHYSVFI